MASKKHEPVQPMAFLALTALLLALAYFALHPAPADSAPAAPSLLFSVPEARLAELSDPAFSRQLFAQAVAFEPLLNTSGTQVSMGFWSGPQNHGSLVRLLDDINALPRSSSQPAHVAIWDEGVQSSLQYPAYVQMNAREQWYARASPAGGKVLVYGVNYTDPHPVSPEMADAIWGAYSRAYAGMAPLIYNATNRTVQVWCFVQGARAGRIFYAYEYPELQRLEQAGIVEVHFAKTRDADWRNAEDWFLGTASMPPRAG